MVRTKWDNYFFEIAEKVSSRATCHRLHVGAVITKNNRILTTGYNGSPSGRPHCDEIGHLIIDNRCHRTIHAESNAISIAAKYGISLENTVCYLTHNPCYTCVKLLYMSGITKVIFFTKYEIDFKYLQMVNELFSLRNFIYME